MDDSIFDLMIAESAKQELTAIMDSNDKSAQFGLQLTQEDAKELLVCRKESLKKFHRIEFGTGIVAQLIDHFCDSPYLDSSNYLSTLAHLQDIFYEYKNLTNDQVTDEELLCFMEEHFNGDCYGDADYLETCCMDSYATQIRTGNSHRP